MNQQAADQFYGQALVVYADRPMREFLYLLGYPFAFPDSNNMPVSGSYVVPANFVTNNSLQRRFVQTLLRRAQQALEVPLDEGDNFNQQPGTEHMLEVLMRIEPQVRALLPIAKGLLSTSEAQTHAREVLDQAITEANKAGMTIFVARALLTASNLYDENRPQPVDLSVGRRY